MGTITQPREGLAALSGWVKIDNTMPENPKVAELGAQAFRLWINAICYASRAQTDGEFTRKLSKSFGVFGLQKSLNELVSSGLVLETEDGYRIKDYLLYNPSRKEIGEMRESNRERTRRWRSSSSDGASDASPNHHPRARSVPSSCSEEEGEQNEQQQDFPRELCRRLADHIVRNDAKAQPRPESEAWHRDMRLLVEDRKGDVAEVRFVLDWSQNDAFWHSNILSPAKLRKQFGQLVLKAQASGKAMDLRRQGSNDEPLSKETAARIRARQKELEELAERDSTATGEGQ